MAFALLALEPWGMWIDSWMSPRYTRGNIDDVEPVSDHSGSESDRPAQPLNPLSSLRIDFGSHFGVNLDSLGRYLITARFTHSPNHPVSLGTINTLYLVM